jgi:hypothetical protein
MVIRFELRYIHCRVIHTPRSSRTCNQPLSACLVRKYRNTSRSRSGSIVLSVVSFKNGMGSFNNQKDSVVPD